MLTFNPIARDRAAAEAAAYYDQAEIEAQLSLQAEYYLGEGTLQVRRDGDPRWHALLGVAPGEKPSREALERFFQGEGPDGTPTLPRQAEHSAYDLTFSASREVAIHWANETDPARQAVYEAAHRGAVRDAMAIGAPILGHTRRGAGGAQTVPGEIFWTEAHHYSSRPTLDLGGTPDMSLKERLMLATSIPGDVNMHTHVVVRNAVLCADGHIGALDTMRLHGIVHELGAIYQARMSARLSAAGIKVVHDRTGIAAAIANTPALLVERMSKRGEQLREAARRYADAQGFIWDDLPASRRFAIEREASSITRAGKLDGPIDLNHFRREIAATGLTLESPIGREQAPDLSPAARAERAALAWQRAAETIGAAFETEAVLDESTLRTHAARALIPLGGGDLADIDAVYAQVVERGVKLHGHTTALLIGEENGKIRATTDAQLQIEQDVVAHTACAAQDRSGAMTPAIVDREIAALDAKDRAGGGKGFTLNPEQQAAAYALSTQGKVAVVIGVAGAGKTTLITPLVASFDAEGFIVLGMATAWRQANELEGTGIKNGKKPRGRNARRTENVEGVEQLRDAGIRDQRIFATAALLSAYEKQKITVDERTVIVIDEISQLGARNALRLLQMQKDTGCRIIGIGDDKQCAAIEAGPVIALLRRALPGQIPEILETIRQRTERDRRIAGLFREGKAAEAIAMKREDGTARLVEGGQSETYRTAAALWVEMTDRCAATPGATFGMSAPSNSDVRGISEAIRVERRRRGEIVGADRVVECTDKRGVETYSLRLAVGDRVRLFDKLYGHEVDATGNRTKATPVPAGVNGTIVEIRSLDDRGITVVGATGRLVALPWEKLRHKDNGRVLLNSGEVFTIDAAQGATRTYWANVLPSGSSAIDARKAYPAESRNREQTVTLVNADAERMAIQRQRGLGSTTPITDDDVWDQVAKNLSRQTEKTSALAFAEAIGAVQRQARDMAAGERNRALIGRAADDARLAAGPPPPSPQPVRSPDRLDQIAIQRVVSPLIRDAVEILRDRTAALRKVHLDLLQATVRVGRFLSAKPTREMAKPASSTVEPAPVAQPIEPTRPPALRPLDGRRLRVADYLERLTEHQAAAAALGSAEVGAYDRAIARLSTMLNAAIIRPDDRVAAASPSDRPAYRAAIQQLADQAALRTVRLSSASQVSHDPANETAQPTPTRRRDGPAR